MLLLLIEGNYLSFWLKQFISSGIISQEHLMYQEIDAFLTEQLTQPNPVYNWQKWPTLYSFCQSLATMANRKGYNFYVGAKRFGLKSERSTIPDVKQYCHPGSLSTLDGKKLRVSTISGPHLANIALTLKVLQSIDGIPHYTNMAVNRFFGIIHYDGMPLNIGTFPRVDDNKVVFDGLKPVISLEKMLELNTTGNASLKKYITESCEWLSEVKE
jgi:hypothetical protein